MRVERQERGSAFRYRAERAASGHGAQARVRLSSTAAFCTNATAARIRVEFTAQNQVQSD